MKATRKSQGFWLFLALMVLSAIGGVGCGGGGGGGHQGTAPTITNLNYSPSSAQLNDGGGTVIVTGTVDFTDPGGDVSNLTIATFTADGQPLSTTTTPVQGVTGKTSGVIAVSVVVPTTVVANYTFQVFLTDATGRTSNSLSGTFSVIAGGGSRTPMTATGPSPAHLVIRNGELFWSEASEDPIKRVSLAGGSPEVLAPKVGVPVGVAVRGEDVFWLDGQSGVAPSGCAGAGVTRVLKKTSVDGTTTTVLATGDNCAGGTSDLIVDGTHVYWVTSTSSPNTYIIQKTPVSGGTSTTVTTTSVPIVAMRGHGGNLYWMENFFPDTVGAIRRVPTSGGAPVTLASGFTSRTYAFAINSTAVFYAEAHFPGGADLMKVPLAGGPTALLATLDNDPLKLAADDTNLYWIDVNAVYALPVAGGSPAVLANTPNTPLDLVVRASDILWSETTGEAHGETGAVKSVPKTGGPVFVLAQGGDAPRQLAVDASSVYWTEGGAIGDQEGFGRIARVPAGGGAVETFVSGVASDSPPITVSDTHIFIADKWRIKKVPLSGGPAETVAAADFYVSNLVTDGAYVYWVEAPFSAVCKVPVGGGDVTSLASGEGPPGPIRLQNGTVFWMDHFDTIRAVPAVGGAVRIVASGLPFLSDFVVDGTNIYFSENDTGDIKKIPVGGGAATTLANGLHGSYNNLAVDGANLYWINQNHIGKVPTTGGTPSFVLYVLASDPFFPASIVLDGTSVYWTEPPIREIWKAQK